MEIKFFISVDGDSPITLQHLIDENSGPDCEEITQEEINSIAKLKSGESTFIGMCEIKRVDADEILDENIVLSKKALKDGETFSFETKDKDHLMVAEISKNEKGEFSIWFNCKFIWIGKSFPCFKRRLEKLIKQWNLEPTLSLEYSEE